ncbi:MAG: GNAT family N-acetyltransferase [Vogesella sp.]|uniref:GNAT family N-acetyltransferase n=1 Tax=Vogesella sp. TaxID=1904252 RepID=UPI0011C9A570
MMNDEIILKKTTPDDIAAFKKELQEAFSLACMGEPGFTLDEPIPSDDDLDKSITSPNSVMLRILYNNKKVGGAIVSINQQTHDNSLDFFFIKSGEHGKGLGRKAWFAIEAHYPETKSWQTHTPYFEKRNIHFYVNVCGFKIVEFFNQKHLDPHAPPSDNLTGPDEAFRFEKLM